MDPFPFSVLILAGGRSRRMGRDKALLRVGGRRIIDLLIRRYRPLSARVLVASGKRCIPDLKGAAQVRDPSWASGPLAGLAAGLAASPTPWILLVTCDQLPPPEALLTRLWTSRRGVRAVAPVLGGRILPMPALYHRSLGASARKADGPSALLKAVPCCLLPVRTAPPSWNTPAAFRRAFASFDPGDAAP